MASSAAISAPIQAPTWRRAPILGEEKTSRTKRLEIVSTRKLSLPASVLAVPAHSAALAGVAWVKRSLPRETRHAAEESVKKSLRPRWYFVESRYLCPAVADHTHRLRRRCGRTREAGVEHLGAQSSSRDFVTGNSVSTSAFPITAAQPLSWNSASHSFCAATIWALDFRNGSMLSKKA
jgi:hypothetical protein